MTALSVNINKLALLRNSRGRDYPQLLEFAGRFIALGVDGITIHPRPDERHIRRQDAYELAELLRTKPEVEFNIEGYPSPAFLKLIEDTRPHQCTLVPDADNQLTSDHGWDFTAQREFLEDVIARIQSWDVRAAVFLDPDGRQVELAAQAGADRIELYTADYAGEFAQGTDNLELYRAAASRAQELGMGVNAGHDLDLNNLPNFLTIPGILEVSIGHALIVECIEQGMEQVIRNYLAICKSGVEKS